MNEADKALYQQATGKEWAYDFDPQVAEKFAELVRADEREACAKVAALTVCDTHIPTGIKIYGTVAAKAIRARGNT